MREREHTFDSYAFDAMGSRLGELERGSMLERGGELLLGPTRLVLD